MNRRSAAMTPALPYASSNRRAVEDRVSSEGRTHTPLTCGGKVGLTIAENHRVSINMARIAIRRVSLEGGALFERHLFRQLVVDRPPGGDDHHPNGSARDADQVRQESQQQVDREVRPCRCSYQMRDFRRWIWPRRR